MSKTINLNAYAERTVDFLFKDQTIRCPELSYKDFQKIQEYEKNDKSTTAEELDIVLWLLNRNKEGRKFTKKDVEDMPAGAVTRFYKENVLLVHKTLTDPN